MTKLLRFLVHLSSWGFGLIMLAWFALIFGSVFTGQQPKGYAFVLVIFTMLLLALIMVWGRWMRERFVREGPLPQFFKRKLREQYPSLSTKDIELVERGLRQFFLACVRSGKKPVAMPSVVVGDAWQEFAHQREAYDNWCKMALGHIAPITPVRRLGASASDNDALRRTWFWACREEAIKPDDPSRLPILFALDAKLAIPGGSVYFANERHFSRPSSEGAEIYYGTSFSNDRYEGSCSDFGGADAGGGDGGGDGGGGD
jgi:uncharacterized membrane protein YgcG